MNSFKKYILLPSVLLAFVLTGCDDLFDKGDVEKGYEGPDTVGFSSLNNTANEGTDVPMEVQLISENGLAQSDVTVNISVSSESTAEPEDYSLSANTVTISSGSATAGFTVSLNSDDGDDDAEETLILNLSADGVQVGENISTATIFIQNAD